MKISYCTTCAQRLHQLEQTWYSNIQSIKNNQNVEWILLNYDADEIMHNFVMTKQETWPDNFIYAKELTDRDWHASVAKNIVHQLGSGDILFNLDCDNFIADSIDVIFQNFFGDTKIIQNSSGIPMDGTYGRIAIDRDLFYKIGGYDESLYPMASQDLDILERVMATKHHLKIVRCSTSFAIKNSKTESIKLCKRHNMNWKQFSDENRIKIFNNLANNIFVSNQPHGMTKPNVEIFRKQSGVVA